VSYEPVNNKPVTERKLAIKKEIPRFVDDVKLNPKNIIAVKFSLYVPVRNALEKAGLGEKILNEKPLPFPSHSHQKTYRQMLRNLVAK
jgi:hypothetical protein